MRKIIPLIYCLILSSNLQAQSFYEEGLIQTIDITFSQSNWDQLLDAEKAGAGNYIMAQKVSINGTDFDSVGVKYKGNSTYNANQVKNPFHIELNTYKDQSYQGYNDIKLSNVANDPSFVREVLSYKILRQYMDAPLSNYANVYVNGVLIGLYSNTEAISKKFVDSRFNSKNNTFIKCNPPAGAGPGSSDYPNLVYLGQDSLDYYASYELESDFGWQELIDLCDTLSNNINEIEAILDVDRALWMLAYDNVLVNLDSYIGAFAQNYYLYRDDNKRFLPVVWDLNESFARFSMTGTVSLNSTTAKQQMSHLLHLNDAGFPLVQKLLNVPQYKRMYLAHYKTILLESFSSNAYYVWGQSLQSTIDAAVQADPNKFFSYANFISNLSNDITGGGGPGGGTTPGIANLMNGRSSYLLGLTDFTQVQPDITNIQVSDSTPNLNDQITISSEIINANTVYLGYRYDLYAPFQKIHMYDDGAHNDGAANDGVYAADVIISNTFLQYYIYAENGGIGKFSPERAEHEFYSLSIVAPPVGNLVINEVMASNVSIVSDQDGEYDDWIEIYNNSSVAIDLSTYYLSDDAGDLGKWRFPSGAIINAHDYFVVWADNDINQAGYHTNFKLSASGESLFLLDTSGVFADQVTFINQTSDISYGRYPNVTGNFHAMTPTHNAENMLNTGISYAGSTDPGLLLFPNPASDHFTLKFNHSNANEMQVNIYDLFGKMIYTNRMNDVLTVNTSGWASGIYFVKVGVSTVRMMVR
ncbi:MAG: T9SS type A sorting domain-containing protein [Bacteroidetes bacterium]|nr:MAG: T9SS type A sorting domain-containing protein [Bacteroidota bacterium]